MKKFLAAFLALVMVLSSLCLPAVANQTTPTTVDVTLTQADFVADANDYDADGNTTEMLARAKIEKALAETPYEDVTETDDDGNTTTTRVYEIPDIVLSENITVTVTADTVFPLLADNFYGNFYGNGKSITFTGDIALKFNTGDTDKGVLFDIVGVNISDDKTTTEVNEEWKIDACIYDLTVKGVNATVSDGTAYGSQFGAIAGSTNRVVTMNNVHVVADLTKNSTEAVNVGGLLGKVNNTSYFIGCSFNGSIGYGDATRTETTVGADGAETKKTYKASDAMSAGGIVGAVVNTTTIESCTVNNNNQTNGKIAASSRAGGLVGVINIGDDKTAAITQKSEVYGKVEVTTGVAGGLVGGVEGNGVLNMSRSGTNYAPTNYAAVTATGGNAGGIIGRVLGSSNIAPQVTLNMISNQGAVTGSGSVAGGMIGLVEKVAQSCEVTKTKDGETVTETVKRENNIKIYNNSANTGAVTGKNFVGGAIGRVKGAGAVVTIDDYVSTGAITATVAFAGGIVGMSDGTKDVLTITNTANLGNVSGANAVGGILANHRTNDAAKIWITGCVNMGAVSTTGAQVTTSVYAGGIVGSTAKVISEFKIADCLNFGIVTNTEEGAATNVNGIYGTTLAGGTAPTLTNNTDFTATNAGTTAVANSALIAMGEEGKAQIRLSNDKADAGIRFAINTNSTLLTALTTAGYTYTLGSLIATDANIGEGALTKDALGNKKYSAKTEGVQVNDDRYMVAVNGIEDTYYAEDVRCAGFIELTNKDGTTYTIYTEASLAKSLADVAKAAIDDTDTEAQAKYAPYKTTLEVFAAKLNSAE